LSFAAEHGKPVTGHKRERIGPKLGTASQLKGQSTLSTITVIAEFLDVVCSFAADLPAKNSIPAAKALDRFETIKITSRPPVPLT
jgi:hypothetical protein